MRNILALIMVLCISLGMTNSVHAQEIEVKTENAEEINLLEQPCIIYDAEGNVVNRARLAAKGVEIPAGGYVGWWVTIYKGNNSMNVGVNPSAKLKLRICNGLNIEQYSYTTSVEVVGVSQTFYNSESDATGLFFIHNMSNYSTTLTAATFAGQ